MQQQCLQNYFGEQLKEVRAMAQEKINAARRQTNLPNESDEYLSKREELRLAEIELMRQRERVAELRRGLPQGAAIQDYVFEERAGEPRCRRHADRHRSLERTVQRA
jgi:predicted dithiol-disulfide oxidoreductase (DUF899 family)